MDSVSLATGACSSRGWLTTSVATMPGWTHARSLTRFPFLLPGHSGAMVCSRGHVRLGIRS